MKNKAHYSSLTLNGQDTHRIEFFTEDCEGRLNRIGVAHALNGVSGRAIEKQFNELQAKIEQQQGEIDYSVETLNFARSNVTKAIALVSDNIGLHKAIRLAISTGEFEELSIWYQIKYPQEPKYMCDVAPYGWKCTRLMGHDGPCAAVKVDNQAAADALREFASRFDAEDAEEKHSDASIRFAAEAFADMLLGKMV